MDIRIEHISHWLGNYPGDLNWANQNFLWKQVKEKNLQTLKQCGTTLNLNSNFL